MNRRSGRKSRHGQPRWLVASVAALYAFVLATVGLHETQHSHRICEHGELVHVDDAQDVAMRASTSACDDATSTLPSVRESLPISSESSAHGHEHCTVALPVVSQPRQATQLVRVVVAPPVRATGLRAAPRAPSSAPLILLAPHHSPPLV